MMTKYILIIFTFFTLVPMAVKAENGIPDPVAGKLAVMLSQEGDHDNSAIEFRRLAMSCGNSESQGAFYRAAAYEYMQAGNDILSEQQLDAAEEVDADSMLQLIFLRANNAYAAERYSEASFYYQVLLDDPLATPEYRQWASRRLAALAILKKSPNQAIAALENAPGNQEHALLAAEYYRNHHDKKPWLGGVLGLIPGMGYMYSGEYANGVRSIILNSLFIFGMVGTAQEDQWGGFAVITFFEITWYSGSIYGGIDSAHRYNRDRQTRCIDDIFGEQTCEVNYADLPLLSFTFSF